jgi:hypothetical protein
MALRKKTPLTNAQHQARWRKRKLISLAADAREIVERLVEMDDQDKLARIVTLLNQKLNPKDGRLRFVKDDGGRSRSGIARGSHKDGAGDCVARAIAIAAQKTYREVHDALIATAVRYAETKPDSPWGWLVKSRRRNVHRLFNADHGVHQEISDLYLEELGWKYTRTFEDGVRLRADELSLGRLIVRTSGHLTAVIDGELHDMFDCSNNGHCHVHGYWSVPA